MELCKDEYLPQHIEQKSANICKNFFPCHSRDSKHPDLSPARIRRDQKDVKTVKDTIDSMFVNPFEEVDLISITSGIAPTRKFVTN